MVIHNNSILIDGKYYVRGVIKWQSISIDIFAIKHRVFHMTIFDSCGHLCECYITGIPSWEFFFRDIHNFTWMTVNIITFHKIS